MDVLSYIFLISTAIMVVCVLSIIVRADKRQERRFRDIDEIDHSRKGLDDDAAGD